MLNNKICPPHPCTHDGTFQIPAWIYWRARLLAPPPFSAVDRALYGSSQPCFRWPSSAAAAAQQSALWTTTTNHTTCLTTTNHESMKPAACTFHQARKDKDWIHVWTDWWAERHHLIVSRTSSVHLTSYGHGLTLIMGRQTHTDC